MAFPLAGGHLVTPDSLRYSALTILQRREDQRQRERERNLRIEEMQRIMLRHASTIPMATTHTGVSSCDPMTEARKYREIESDEKLEKRKSIISYYLRR